MLGAEFQRGIRELRAHGLTYDILIFPKQLPAAIELVRNFPAQPFVLDHIAKPFIKDGLVSPWREQIRELAKCPNVLCKVSGMVTEAKWNAWLAQLPFTGETHDASGEFTGYWIRMSTDGASLRPR